MTALYLRPGRLDEALEARSRYPDAVPVAGGTDLMVEVNFGRHRPASLLDLSGVEELSPIESRDGWMLIGATATYRQMIDRLGAVLPALVEASRSVASPPIRNRGTIGGNLGSASPAGDCHPPLLAYGAEIHLASVRGRRTVPAPDFFLGPKHSVMQADELITGVAVPAPTGPGAFAKVGSRAAMVIAVCSASLVLDPPSGTVRTGIGSAGPVPLRATLAEDFLEGHLRETGGWESASALPEAVVARFADLVAGACRPIDDVRGLAVYRRHAVEVLARRLLDRCWEDHRREGRPR